MKSILALSLPRRALTPASTLVLEEVCLCCLALSNFAWASADVASSEVAVAEGVFLKDWAEVVTAAAGLEGSSSSEKVMWFLLGFF